MILRRCQKCRTFCEGDAPILCSMCGSLLPATPGRPVQPAEAPAQARRDHGSARIAFSVIGILAALNFSLGLGTSGLLVPFLAILLILAALVSLLARGMNPDVDRAGRVILNVFAGIGILVVVAAAAAFGLLILLFVVCASGGLKIG